MNTRLLHCIVALLLIGCGLLRSAPAHATITCTSASMSAVSFGTVNPLSSQTGTTATLSYTCSNNSGSTNSATVCFSIGEPGGGQTSPSRLMKSGNNSLQFNLYQDASYTTVWGSSFFGSDTPLIVNLTLGGRASTTQTATLYAQVLSGQTSAVPGTYSDNYGQFDTAVIVNSTGGNTPPGVCGGSTSSQAYFPFNVTATVTKNCTVSANNLSLGSVAAGTTPSSSSSTLSIACSNTTPYNVGLSPTNGNTSGAGKMTGAASGSSIAYQLYQNSSLTTAWGNNNVTPTSVGNGVAATGSGMTQTLTVYAKATGSTDVTPDTYTDTVTVFVNY